MQPPAANARCAAELFARSRDLAVPFVLNLPGLQPATVVEVLRLLPGRRIVARANWPGREVVLKLFSRHRDCSRELRGLRALANAGIATPQVLAEVNAGDTHAVLLEWLPNAETLAVRLRTATGRECKQQLLAKATALVAGMHDAGIVQRDIHLGNFLISNDTLHVVDGAAVQTPRRGVRQQQALANLALLHCQVALPERSDADTILDSYHRAAVITPWQLDDAMRRQDLLRSMRLARKATRECSDLMAQCDWHGVRLWRRDRDSTAVRALLADPDRAMRDARVLKDGNSARVTVVDVDGYTFAIKRYHIKSWRHAVARCLRTSRAWHSWRMAHALRGLGIAAPLPVAVIERRCGPLRGAAWYISEFIDGPSLKDHLVARDPAPVPEWIDRDLLTLFDALARIRHSHGDCKATNFLLRDQRVWTLDLDSMRGHWSAAGLMRALRRDRQRFLRNWSGTLLGHFTALLATIR